MASLLFQPGELLSELGALQTLAAGFLDRTSPYQLAELASEIRGLWARGGTYTVEIPERRPLQTRSSTGEFEPLSKKSGRRVHGVITGIWELEAADYLINPDRPRKKARKMSLIGFTGIASTVIEVKDESSGDTVARWKMELGDAYSPGCFFHTFASRDDSFPVPRHPNVFATPMAAIDFALGELFQGSWEKVLSGTTDAPNRWRSIQARRFEALLNWQLDMVANTTSSPWCSLKSAKPEAELFL
jgi:hypothetical protein